MSLIGNQKTLERFYFIPRIVKSLSSINEAGILSKHDIINIMEIIQSRDNKKIKEARKLLQKKYRTAFYLIEGFHLLKEARNAQAEIIQVFVAESKLGEIKELDNVIAVSDEVLKSLSDTESPQGVVAVVAQSEQLLDFTGEAYLILENIQDPGNVGTMVRTADAGGYDGVILIGDTADMYSPKVLRAMQGSHFHIPVITSKDKEILNQAKQVGVELLATTLSANSVSYQEIKKPEKFALIMGNEGSGVSEYALSQADQRIHISMAGQAESLNVAVAAGILMFGIK